MEQMQPQDYACDTLTDAQANLEARRINEVLASRGLNPSQVTAWWDTSNPGLDGFTPVYLWNGNLPGQRARVRRLLDQDA